MKKFMAVLAMVAVVAFAAPALAATNPFMDVPQGHWSYDAVGLLASRGIVSGYPDGAFKGAQPATRIQGCAARDPLRDGVRSGARARDRRR